MTHKQLHKVRFWSNIGFDIVSAALTVNFFISIPKKVVEKGLYALFGISVEGAKLYLASLVKDSWKITFGKTVSGWRRAAKALFATVMTTVYLGTAGASAFMSVGYILLTVKLQSQSVVAMQVEEGFSARSQMIKRLAEIDREIEIQQKNMGDVPPGYATATSIFGKEIAKLQEERKEITKTLESSTDEELPAVEEQEVASDTIFSELGAIFDFSGQEMLLRIMLVLAILLEVFVFITIGTAEDDKIDVRENPDKIKVYLASMFEGITNGKRLRSDWVISKETGLDINECNRYRNFLSEMTWKGTPLFVKNKTGMNANFSRENIEKIVMLKMSIGGNK